MSLNSTLPIFLKVQEDVTGLDISMNDAWIMQIIDC